MIVREIMNIDYPTRFNPKPFILVMKFLCRHRNWHINCNKHMVDVDFQLSNIGNIGVKKLEWFDWKLGKKCRFMKTDVGNIIFRMLV